MKMLAAFGIGVALSLSLSAHAAEVTTDFVPLTGVDVSSVELAPFMTKAFSQDASLATFVNAMFLAAVGLGAMLAVLQLARAGFYYMGSDAWGKKEEGKRLMQNAVFGLLLLLAVWLILEQINPQIKYLDVLEGIRSNPLSPSGSSPPTPFIGSGGGGRDGGQQGNPFDASVVSPSTTGSPTNQVWCIDSSTVGKRCYSGQNGRDACSAARDFYSAYDQNLSCQSQ